MKISIDTDTSILTIEEEGSKKEISLFSDEAFEVVSRQWLDIGWNQKYVYTFSWFGRPIIQLPDDIIRAQEAIWEISPDVIVETGVAHGGSLIFYASLCKAIGKGRVIGIDVEIRPHNLKAIESHPLFEYIILIEGSSIDKTTIDKFESLIEKDESVLVFLDSNHSKEHVSKELSIYNKYVSKGSYIIATDGIMQYLSDVPRGEKEWIDDNPSSAAIEFAKDHPEFTLESPNWQFNESTLNYDVTHWPSAWLKRI